MKVAKRADGKFQTEIVEKVFDNYADAYAKECAAELSRHPVAGDSSRDSRDGPSDEVARRAQPAGQLA